MSANKFENMNAKEIVNEILDIESGPKDVDAAFEALKTLDADTSKQVIDKVEKVMIKDTRAMAEQFDGLAPLATGVVALFNLLAPPKEIAEVQKEDAQDLTATQSTCQIFVRIAAVKGDEAKLLTKAVVKELFKLSKEDQSSTLQLEIAAAVAVNKTDAAKAAKKGAKAPRM